MNKRIGIVCVNLGSPNSYQPVDIKKFLKRFLADERVIRLPKLLWWPILNGIILNIRPKKLSALYEKIWLDDGSPLVVIGNNQAKQLERSLNGKYDNIDFTVKFACCYSDPDIETVYSQLLELEVEQIVFLPMYPQYSSFTSGIVYNRVNKCIHPCQGGCAFRCKNPKMCNQYQEYNLPKVTMIHDYYRDDAYISAIATTIKYFWLKNGQAKKLVFSYHGIPKSSESSNLYLRQCMNSSELIAEYLGLTKDDFVVSFQSRFGFAEWMQPYTKDVLVNLAAKGVKDVQIVCPGFSADCLETLEEVALELKADFLTAGGEKYQYIPALNESKLNNEMLTKILNQYLV